MRTSYFVWALTLAVSVAGLTSSSRAENAITLTLQSGQSLSSQSGAAALLAKASAKGKVRVIAGLNLTMSNADALSGAAAAAQSAALARSQDTVLSRVQGGVRSDAVKFDSIPFVSLWVTSTELARLMNDPSVTSIQEDVPAELYLTQSVPLINANDVWATGKTGVGETVAILDTGVHKTHVMFPGGKVASEACYSTNSAGTTSLCPGAAASSIAAGSGVNCPTAIVGCDHGTHVAGIVAGNHPDLKGVAPGATLIAIKVFTRFNNAGDCSPGAAPCVKSFTTDQVSALNRVFALRNAFDIAAVNMSLGGGQFSGTCDSQSPAETAAILQLRNAGIATVIASGNESLNGFVGAPSCISSAISVGSTDKTDVISSFSNHAPIVKLLAPGGNIRSAGATSNTATVFKSGTSMATPHVAGAYALLADVKEGAGVSEILSALNCTGKQISRGGLFRPRIDLLAARTELLAANVARSFSFASASQGTAWTKFINTWAVSGGFFRGTFSGSNFWTLAALKYCSPAFRVTASIRRPAASENLGGLALFSNVAATGVAVSGYIFHFDPTDVRIRRFNNAALGGGSVIGNTFDDACVTNRTNSTAAFHTIRVDAVRGVYSFFFDGTLICTLTDRVYPPAWVGLIASRQTSTTTGQSILVNSVDITPLSVAAPSEVVASAASDTDGAVAEASFTAVADPVATAD